MLSLALAHGSRSIRCWLCVSPVHVSTRSRRHRLAADSRNNHDCCGVPAIHNRNSRECTQEHPRSWLRLRTALARRQCAGLADRSKRATPATRDPSGPTWSSRLAERIGFLSEERPPPSPRPPRTKWPRRWLPASSIAVSAPGLFACVVAPSSGSWPSWSSTLRIRHPLSTAVEPRRLL